MIWHGCTTSHLRSNNVGFYSRKLQIFQYVNNNNLLKCWQQQWSNYEMIQQENSQRYINEEFIFWMRFKRSWKQSWLYLQSRRTCQVSSVQDLSTSVRQNSQSAWFRHHLHTMKTWVQTVIDTQKFYARWSILLPGSNKTNNTVRSFRNSCRFSISPNLKSNAKFVLTCYESNQSIFLTPVDTLHCHDLFVLLLSSIKNLFS